MKLDEGMNWGPFCFVRGAETKNGGDLVYPEPCFDTCEDQKMETDRNCVRVNDTEASANNRPNVF